MTSAQEKLKKLEKAISSIKSQKGNEGLKLGFGDLPPVNFIPTPFPSLNDLTGGGFPRGKNTTLAGAERTAKSTLMLQTIAHNQSLDPNFIALWTDAENAWDPIWAQKMGVDLNRVIVQQYSDSASYAEKLLDHGIDLIATKAIDIWVIDSVAALLMKSEEDKKVEENTMLDLQRKLPVFFRKCIRLISPTENFPGTAVVLIGQIYNVPNTTGYPLVEVKGGNALKHWAYLRLMTRRGGKDESPPTIKLTMPDGTTRQVPSGWAQHIKLEKTKTNDKENQEIVLQFYYGRGLDSIGSIFSCLLFYNIVERAGGWYKNELFPEGKIQGREAVLDFLKENPDVTKQLVSKLEHLTYQEDAHEE